MEFNIIRLGKNGEDIEDGVITWNPDNGDWGFKTNNTRIADALRKINDQGYVYRSDVVLVNFDDGGSARVHHSVQTYSSDRLFMSGIQEYLIDYDVLWLTPLTKDSEIYQQPPGLKTHSQTIEWDPKWGKP